VVVVVVVMKNKSMKSAIERYVRSVAQGSLCGASFVIIITPRQIILDELQLNLAKPISRKTTRTV
jgi:hypothetical protein